MTESSHFCDASTFFQYYQNWKFLAFHHFNRYITSPHATVPAGAFTSAC